MKRFTVLFSVLLVVVWSGIASANFAPVVSNVSANQRGDDSKLVDIRYDLADADGDSCTVWVVGSNDGGLTWRVPIISVWGHIGKGVTPGVNRQVVWDAGGDIAGVVGDFKVRVYADDGNSADGLVLIPGGQFQMGDSLGWPYELPLHWVFVDAFMMSRYEVTNQQYVEFLNNAFANNLIEVKADNIVYKKTTAYAYCATYDAMHDSRIGFTGSLFSLVPSDKGNHPVHVTWHGAAAYCNWRSEQLGKELCYNATVFTPDLSKHGCRLPTEAEWEMAARGGLANKRFPWGDTITHSEANYYSSTFYAYDISPTRGYHPTYAVGDWPYTAPVGSFSANGYDLFDMAGNVSEWCNDWYQGDYYGSSPYYNPPGPATGSSRVVRGGNCGPYADQCRVAYRNAIPPENCSGTSGFRLVLDLE
jgi:formylglycine-generating enzyme required for sulfatase activity